METKEILRKIKGVFKLPKKEYYLGRVKFGAPYFYPYGLCRSIIKIKKTKYDYDPCRWIKLFGYYVYYGSPIKYVKMGLGWKDKYDSPSFEWTPFFTVYFFYWQFYVTLVSPDCNNRHLDTYWEMILWYLEYSNEDIKKAEDTWGWVNYETKKSTWKKEYLV